MVHCQGGPNPPSPAPPLVLGTLLPHFISGKFSQLLAQTQARVSRRGVCWQLAPPGAGTVRGDTGDTRGHGGYRGHRGHCGAAAGAVRALPAPARSQPSPGPCPPCPSTAPRAGAATSGPRAIRVLPLSPGCPGLGPGGLAASSNLIWFGSWATQRAFVRLKHLIWSRDLQPAHSPQWSQYKQLVKDPRGKAG